HAVLAALRQETPAWRDLTERDLAEMIGGSSKQRHEMAGGRIRALYGHSLPGKLRRMPATPPAELFHGTAPETVQKIRKSGLLPGFLLADSVKPPHSEKRSEGRDRWEAVSDACANSSKIAGKTMTSFWERVPVWALLPGGSLLPLLPDPNESPTATENSSAA